MFIYRYCLSVITSDQTNEAEFSLFGSHVEQIIGSTFPTTGGYENTRWHVHVCCVHIRRKFPAIQVVYGPKS